MSIMIVQSLRKYMLLWPGPVAVISIAQLMGTALWFSTNSVMADLENAWGMSSTNIALLTAAVQLGFILGTLVLSLSGLADRYRASGIFVVSVMTGSLLNAFVAIFSNDVGSAFVFRFGVGVCLAGVYPVGMKLIISWVPEKTGSSLSLLVAMLTLGTALPHGLRFSRSEFPWESTVLGVSILALLGGALIYALGDGPHLARKQGDGSAYVQTQYGSVLTAFKNREFRAAAFGYFGHMWELYAFWTIIPLLIVRLSLDKDFAFLGVSGLSFLIISSGALACILGGRLSSCFGNALVAFSALAISASCIVVVALWGSSFTPALALFVLLIWGGTVVADSPLFSSISAKVCPQHLVGSALAVQNSIGFGLTIVSIMVTTYLVENFGLLALYVLLPGPVFGLLAFFPLLASRS